MNDLVFLSEEFGFASLLFHGTTFISVRSAVNGETRRCVSDLEEKNGQQG
jgi:hypothetical protein